MRRADRLFQIIQALRRTRKPLTADAIAAELETSKRTIYRDIATLIGQRVPIRGEAGMGYILEKGFDLPPLSLTPDEIEAAVLGAQWVVGHADPVLARAAQDLMAKIADTVPERLRPFVLEPASRAPPLWNREPDRIDMVRNSDSPVTVESPCQACGACCAYSQNWPRFTTEDDAALDLIPEKFVNQRLSGMRCDGERCCALSGKVGVAPAGGTYP